MEKTEKRKNIIALSLIILSVIMIFAGIFRGEAELVFHKAVRICMECIGIG